MLRVTVDTNVFGTATMARLSRALDGVDDVELAPTTVSLRERPLEPSGRTWIARETAVWNEPRWGGAVWTEPVCETATFGEAAYGASVFGGDESASRIEEILTIIGSGSFPKPGRRGELSPGALRQLRDALILEAHARDSRDVFVSDDVKGYIRDGRRERLEELCRTRIMTIDGFCAYAETLPRPS
jgi:hypothetical protein